MLPREGRPRLKPVAGATDLVGVGHFFGNPPQIRALRTQLIPELIAKGAGQDRRLRIWSAGCGTGEEAYTLAILFREQLTDPQSWDVQILGTDASAAALAVADAGRYPLRSTVLTEPADLTRWFDRRDDDYVIRPGVRSMVDLRRHELLADPLPYERGAVDLVACSGLPADLGTAAVQKAMARLHSVLSDGGYLILGGAEALAPTGRIFRLIQVGDAYVYRRDATGRERRAVLRDRRTADEGAPPLGLGPERRVRARRVQGKALETAQAAPSWPGMPVLTQPSATALLSRARTALAAGDWDTASTLARQAARRDPLAVEAWYLSGIALVSAGRDSDALADLRKATYADPRAGFAHFALAGVLARLGHAVAAARSYRTAASTLGRPGDEVAPELGGRTLPELVAVCHQLADALEDQGLGGS